MKRITAILVILFSAILAQAQTSVFTYQGKLNDGANPANGSYLLELKLFDRQTIGAGTQVGATLTDVPANIVNGIFTVQLDFGATAFTGGERFMEISVRRNTSESYVTLAPRQPISSAPYAVKSLTANDANMLGGQPASAYGTSAQITTLSNQIAMLQMQNTTLQGQIMQLQTDLAATTVGTQIWAKRVADDTGATPSAVAVNGSNDVVITGSFQGTVHFGGVTLTSAGVEDVFVAKYSGATGAFMWAKRFGSTSEDRGTGLAVDALGDVFVTGNFSGTVNFGGSPLASAGNLDVFLVKLSGADGSHVWSRRFGGTDFDGVFTVTVDGSGNPLICGSFLSAAADFGGTPLVRADAGFGDVFVAKYNGVTNAHIWSKGFGGSGGENARSASTDGSGNVFITGNFASPSITFGGAPLVKIGAGDDIFLVKLASADGSHIWSKRLGGSGVDEGISVAVDGSGSVFVTGVFNGATIDLGGGPLANAGTLNSNDIFLAKYDAAGLHQWSKAFAGTIEDQVYGVALDSGGNPVITGNFAFGSLGSVTFGEIPLNSVGGGDIFVAKFLGNSGMHQWSRRFGGSGGEGGRSLAVGGSDDIFVIGGFDSQTIDFGGGPLVTATGHGFLVKLRR